MPQQPIVVEVLRNGIVEATHRVHAVAVRDGAVIAEAGDAALTCYMRSSSKPIQALPLARARDDLDARDLAIASASHRGTDDQIAAVEALLAKAPAREQDLELGPQPGRPPPRRFHNCSGKHAGMLALCRAQGWPLENYVGPEHPVQRACLDVHAEAAAVDAAEIPTAIDGCGVLAFALPLERMAHAYARFETLPAGAAIAAAIRGHPDLVGGPDGVDYELMRAAPGWLAKGGAEGLLCAARTDGLGVALKAQDGAGRALGPALAAFLAPLDTPLPSLERIPIVNTRRQTVGEIRVNSS